jgi:hypothetical protein
VNKRGVLRGATRWLAPVTLKDCSVLKGTNQGGAADGYEGASWEKQGSFAACSVATPQAAA